MAQGQLQKTLQRSNGKYDFYGKPIPEKYKKGDYSTYPQAKFTPEGKKSSKGMMHFYNPETGVPVGAIAKLPKSRKDMSLWEKHLKRMGGKSKYFKNEKELLDNLRKPRKKKGY